VNFDTHCKAASFCHLDLTMGWAAAGSSMSGERMQPRKDSDVEFRV